jgi:hypothetical protein
MYIDGIIVQQNSEDEIYHQVYLFQIFQDNGFFSHPNYIDGAHIAIGCPLLMFFLNLKDG